MKAEWHTAPRFSEAAEAIGVRAFDVFAMWPIGDGVTQVLYTDEDSTEDDYLISARLHRDSDGIFRRKSPDAITDMRVRDIVGQP